MLPIKCAFKNSKFSSDNWNCETMNRLRDLVIDDYDGEKGEGKCLWNEDQKCGIYAIPETGEFLVLSWYKRRGRTDGAWIVNESEVRNLTLKDAKEIIKGIK